MYTYTTDTCTCSMTITISIMKYIYICIYIRNHLRILLIPSYRLEFASVSFNRAVTMHTISIPQLCFMPELPLDPLAPEHHALQPSLHLPFPAIAKLDPTVSQSQFLGICQSWQEHRQCLIQLPERWTSMGQSLTHQIFNDQRTAVIFSWHPNGQLMAHDEFDAMFEHQGPRLTTLTYSATVLSCSFWAAAAKLCC